MDDHPKYPSDYPQYIPCWWILMFLRVIYPLLCHPSPSYIRSICKWTPLLNPEIPSQTSQPILLCSPFLRWIVAKSCTSWKNGAFYIIVHRVSTIPGAGFRNHPRRIPLRKSWRHTATGRGRYGGSQLRGGQSRLVHSISGWIEMHKSLWLQL